VPDPILQPVPIPVPIPIPVPYINNDADVAVNIKKNLKLMGATFSIQNVRTLNISTKNDITVQKLVAICNLKSDFILLSDLRLNSKKQISALHDLEKKFFLQGYKFYHNSQNSLRGVGILINKKFSDSDFNILSTTNMADGNAMFLHLNVNNTEILLCVVYGPNKDTDIGFYENLKNRLRQYNCPIIMGGDWNATYDVSNVERNLDVINMLNIPSIRRSNKIHDICNDLDLVEPFRLKYPDRREYTFIPSGVN